MAGFEDVWAAVEWAAVARQNWLATSEAKLVRGKHVSPGI